MNPSVDIPLVVLGVPFHPVTNDETLAWCVDHIRKGVPGYVTTPNLDFVMQAQGDPELTRILAQANLVIADGMPIIWLSGKLGPRLPERVAGSDLVVRLAEASAREGFGVFHLGGAAGVPQKAGEVLAERFPGFRLAGAYSPPKADLLEMNHEKILHKLTEASPDILFVAFGAPKQEKWINLHFRDWKVPLALGIGGSLDFLAGAQKRAPKWMQKSGTEWIWRMGTDPKRLFKRYWNNGRFLLRALREIRAIRRLSATAVPPLLPVAPDGHEDFRFQLIRWKPLQTHTAAEALLTPFLGDPDPRPIVIDFTGAAWLSSFELGVLLCIGRAWKSRNQLIFRTGACECVDRWLTFNLIDGLIERVDASIDWDKRLAPRSAAELRKVLPAESSPARGAFGKPQKRSRVVLDEAHHLCLLYPPEELTALTLPAWKELVEDALLHVPANTRAILLDAAELRFLDSAGLGYFMHIRKRADALRLRFEIQNLGGAPLTTIRLARVEKLLLSSSPQASP